MRSMLFKQLFYFDVVFCQINCYDSINVFEFLTFENQFHLYELLKNLRFITAMVFSLASEYNLVDKLSTNFFFNV